MDHLPLSQRIAHLVQNHASAGSLTLHEMIDRTEGRGFYLLIVLLALPVLLPVSVPGLSTLIGSVIAVLAWRLVAGRRPKLPAFLGRRALSPRAQQAVLTQSGRVLRFLDKIARRRRTAWLNWPLARAGNALVMLLMAVLLALPVPLPFSNPLPSSAVILVAVSMMEEDGVLIWFGYALAAGAVSFFGFFGSVVVEMFGRVSSIL